MRIITTSVFNNKETCCFILIIVIFERGSAEKATEKEKKRRRWRFLEGQRALGVKGSDVLIKMSKNIWPDWISIMRVHVL